MPVKRLPKERWGTVFVPTGPAVVYASPGVEPAVLGLYVLEAYRVSKGATEIVVRFDLPADGSKEEGSP